ncbi:MAG: mttA/Hcf106 family [Chloroflexi bacterium]|nr:mttA/Hcf106 family [Chloroflexota bacterium]
MPIPQGPELIIILLLALILFGTSKIGDVGGALGKSIREFRRSASDENPENDETEKNKHSDERGTTTKSS